MFPHPPRRSLLFLALAACLLPVTAQSTDVDGPGDCDVTLQDYGDAPEGVDAYPGKLGAFPTCIAAGPVGTQESDCLPALSTAPGAAGAVVHLTDAAEDAFWLGCGPVGGPILGIDTESDGKTNAGGGPTSFCNDAVNVDCVEAAWALSFGQDECYGSSDAGIASPLFFTTCELASFDFQTYNCGPNDQDAYLNVLVDMNEDADWNDNFQCPGGPCAYEWAVKNVPIVIPPGCNTLTTPTFLIGPREGRAWLRITISAESVSDDFPWQGTYTAAGAGQISNGETEDYPVFIGGPYDPCDLFYEEYGDAPEEIQAYPGVPGRFPTCSDLSVGSDQNVDCPAISTPPGGSGYVKHVHQIASTSGFWFGCPDLSIPFSGVDGDGDGKTNDTGGPISVCNAPNEATDCVENAFGLSFGQDECYADEDAGLDMPLHFTACSDTSFRFEAHNCATGPQTVFLNVLVDMNEDGDWNDNFLCPDNTCAYEWAVKNVPILLNPGCGTYSTPTFRVGPNGGNGWMRLTMTRNAVTDDFPWNGSGAADFEEGETEDYPIDITQTDGCEVSYEDFGDAPEEIEAYPGVIGNFPTCLFDSGPGTQEVRCDVGDGTAPGLTGFVRHLASAGSGNQIWLGCGVTAIDSEKDGKVSSAAASLSACDPTVLVDCVETTAGGELFGQDECYGDLDSGLPLGPETMARCSLATVEIQAFNCTDGTVNGYLNILVDWSQDGDWNDNVRCDEIAQCAHEWAVKNKPISLPPGCTNFLSPDFRVGPKIGTAWMRVTISVNPATDDFPWAGSKGMTSDAFRGGETEDYPVEIIPSLIDVPVHQDFGELRLAPPVPNPASGNVMLRYTLPTASHVRLDVVAPNGRLIRTLESGPRDPGEHVVDWSFRDQAGREVPAGVYLIRLRVGDAVLTQRAVRMQR